MKPRLNSSTKWTHFPLEFTQQIEDVFKQGFAEILKDGKLIVEGRIYPAEITLRVGYIESGRLKQANFEISSDLPPGEDKTLETIHLCVDAAGSMMAEYVEADGEVEFPYLWTECDFNGSRLYMQYSTENSDLEAEANRLLGISENDSMVAGQIDETDEESEEALDRADYLPMDELQKEREAFLAKHKAHSKDELH